MQTLPHRLFAEAAAINTNKLKFVSNKLLSIFNCTVLSLERVEEAGGGPAGEREAAQDRGVAGQEGGHAGAGQQQEAGPCMQNSALYHLGIRLELSMMSWSSRM